MAKLTGREQRRLQPKLRMIRNGDVVVNALRSEHSPSVSVAQSITRKMGIRRLRGDHCGPVPKPRKTKGKKPGPGKPSDSKVSVFIDSQTRVKLGKCRGACGRQVIAEVTLAQLDKLAGDPLVSHVELGESVRVPNPIEGATHSKGPKASDRKIDVVAEQHV